MDRNNYLHNFSISLIEVASIVILLNGCGHQELLEPESGSQALNPGSSYPNEPSILAQVNEGNIIEKESRFDLETWNASGAEILYQIKAPGDLGDADCASETNIGDGAFYYYVSPGLLEAEKRYRFSVFLRRPPGSSQTATSMAMTFYYVSQFSGSQILSQSASGLYYWDDSVNNNAPGKLLPPGPVLDIDRGIEAVGDDGWYYAWAERDYHGCLPEQFSDTPCNPEKHKATLRVAPSHFDGSGIVCLTGFRAAVVD